MHSCLGSQLEKQIGPSMFLSANALENHFKTHYENPRFVRVQHPLYSKLLGKEGSDAWCMWKCAAAHLPGDSSQLKEFQYCIALNEDNYTALQAKDMQKIDSRIQIYSTKKSSHPFSFFKP